MNTRHEQILILKCFSEQEGRLIDDLLEAVAAALDLPDLAGPASGTLKLMIHRESASGSSIGPTVGNIVGHEGVPTDPRTSSPHPLPSEEGTPQKVTDLYLNAEARIWS